jgi:sugar phosphate isomerase/epimerase
MSQRILQVQPQFQKGDEWIQLAEKSQLYIECMELSMPSFLDHKELSEKAEEWYRNTERVTSLHGCFMDVNPGSGDEKFRILSMERCRESCKLAMNQKAGYVVFHSTAFPFLRGAYLEIWAERCAGFYVQLAEEYNLTLCIENSFDLDPEPLRVLMERINHPRVRVCLDIGHANHSHAPLTKWFEELGLYIEYLHLSDNRGQFDEHLPIGDGSVDWKLADTLYRKLGKNIPMTLEVGGLEGVKKSLQYIKENVLFEEILSNE